MDSIVLKDRITTRMTDEEFFWFCQENKDLRIERNDKLEIVIMAPVYTLGGYRNGEVVRQLANWAVEDGTGLVFDSSTGFTLNDRSVRCPDAAWVSLAKWNQIPESERERFAAVCPEFIIEIRSASDSLGDLRQKCLFWLQNGAALVWLIDPKEKQTHVYRADKNPEVIKGFKGLIAGEGPVRGFELDLSLLRI